MAIRRIVYALMLVAAIAALIVTDSGIALFVCVLLVVLPVISSVLLYAAHRHVKLDCSVNESCIRGNALNIKLKVGVTPRFFVGTAQVVALIENTTFNKKEYKSFIFKDLSFGEHNYAYIGQDSGRITVKLVSVRLIDIFGVCSRKVKCSEFVESSISPVLFEGLHIDVGVNKYDSATGDRSLPKQGNDITEIYNIRDYAPGDSLGAVHWKLSGKFDMLKSKEFGSADDRKLLVLADMSRKKSDNTATDAHLNGVLDVTISVSDALKTRGYSHTVGWIEDGEFFGTDVNDSNTFVDMVNKLMSIKVNEGDEESMFYIARLPVCSGFTKIIYVTSSVEDGEFRDNGGTNITAITVGDVLGDMVDTNAVRVINVPHDSISTALANCVL